MSRVLLLILCSGLLSLLQCATLFATPKLADSYIARSAFETPQSLRARVDFWKYVFTRYGKDQVVIHHREFPQAIFGELDFRRQAETLNPVALERYKKNAVNARITEIKNALLKLGSGKPLQTALEQHVEQVMRKVPGGAAKFTKAVRDDLVRSQTGIREKFAEAISRSGRYLPIIERIFVQEFNLPIELTRMPFIESSFNYQAYSSVGAAGIWQFMRSTGRRMLMINNAVDERLDVVQASRAAARYLDSAYRSLGNWPLAVTSYNHGVAGVARKVKKIGSADLAYIIEHPSERVFGFASSNFYPEFLAALEVYRDRLIHFPEITLEHPLNFIEKPLSQAVSVQHVLNQLSLDREQFKALNYGILPAAWNGRVKLPVGYRLKIPSTHEQRFAMLRQPELMQPPSAPAASSIYGGATYKVRPGDTLHYIAKKYGISLKELQDLNGLSRPTIRVGQILRVRSKQAPSLLPKLESVSTAAKPKAPRTGSYKILPGDSLWSISRKFGVSLAALKQANPAFGKRIKPGQTIVIP